MKSRMSRLDSPILYHPLARGVSLLLAIPMCLLLLIHPAAMLDDDGAYSHRLLMLVMWGVSAGFVHGVGFKPRFWLWKIVFGPLIGWPFMLLGYLILLKAQLG